MVNKWGRGSVAVVVAAVLAMTACGGGDDGDAAGAGGSTTTTSEASGADRGTGSTTTEGEEDLVMPDVIGLTEAEAREALEEQGVEDFEVIERESLEEAGTVIDQVPGSGQRISGPVNLIVAKPVGAVPDFVGSEVSEVQEWAGERDIEVRLEEVLDDTLDDGEVISTTPAAGEDATSEILVEVARTPVIGQLSEVEPVDSDCTRSTGEVTINGDLYPNSVYPYNDYEDECGWEYNLGRDWVRLKATIGLSDDSSSQARYRFEVFGDGTSLFNEIVSLGATVDVDVDMADVLRLRIQVTSVGAGDAYPVWGDLRVIGSPDDVGEDEGSAGSTTTTGP